MTFKERLMQESKERLVEIICSEDLPCPGSFGYADELDCSCGILSCTDCWNREMPEEIQK